MSLLHSIFNSFIPFIGCLGTRPPAESVHALRTTVRLRMLACGVVWCLCITAAWNETCAAADTANGTIVAAGFGYQLGDVSIITVKVYDAASGEVLSDETFDLNINEGEGRHVWGSQDRIFAGGVGPGATDLSNFLVRVYDAKTGRFQWEGQLNLKAGDGSGGGQLVSTVVPRRAVVTKIRAVEPHARQPMFVLRALDRVTGGLVWEDEFSTDSSRSFKLERIGDRPAAMGHSTDFSPTFDFRIRMVDRGIVLWEDQVAQPGEDEDAYEAADDEASMLPAWPRTLEFEAPHSL